MACGLLLERDMGTIDQSHDYENLPQGLKICAVTLAIVLIESYSLL